MVEEAKPEVLEHDAAVYFLVGVEAGGVEGGELGEQAVGPAGEGEARGWRGGREEVIVLVDACVVLGYQNGTTTQRTQSSHRHRHRQKTRTRARGLVGEEAEESVQEPPGKFVAVLPPAQARVQVALHDLFWLFVV